jgi:hypothetical protein
MNRIQLLSVVIFLSTLCLACGGGGGDGTIEPAQVSIQVTPDVLDSGERTRIRLKLYDFSDTKVIVKVRFPAGLDFVADSAAYFVDNQDVEIDPGAEAAGDDQDYLVFFVNTEELNNPDNLELLFQLRGVDDVLPSEIEVDIDLDDEAIANDVEFTVETPQFDIQESAYIQVGAAPATTTTTTAN